VNPAAAIPGDARWRALAAASTALYGVLTVLSAITDDIPWRHDLLLTVEPGPIMALGHVLVLGAGLGLVYLARGVLHRSRRAMNATIVLLIPVALLHLLKGLDYEEAGVAVALAIVLARGRRACTRRAAARPPLLAATVAVGAVAAIYAISCGICAAHRHLHSASAVLSAGARLLDSGAWLRVHGPLKAILELLFVAAIGAATLGLRGLLRPAPAREGHSAAEHEVAVAIVKRFGDDSLAPFVLREDKAFFFAHDGFLAYRTLRETAVVSGDPIGPPGSAQPILAEFLRHADNHGWRVAVAAASPALAAGAPDLGLRALQVGCEAVVDVFAFTLEGRAIRKVRQAVARVERHGWRCEIVTERDLDERRRSQIAALEREFRSTHSRITGFAMSLGRIWGAPEDDEALYALGWDQTGGLGALIRFGAYRRGLSLDAVRRRADMPNGVCEALVVCAIEAARAAGRPEVSLNFAGFAHIMSPTRPLRPAERVLRLVLNLVHSRFQLERLAAWSDHFRPEWRPRYVLYGGHDELARSGLRVLQAEQYLPSRPVPPLKPRWEPVLPPVQPVPQLQRR
jgi:lysyl-tRNA synthetase, class II